MKKIKTIKKFPPPTLNTAIHPDIVSLLSVPGVTLSDELINTLVSTAKGIIVQGFGTGNLPTQDSSWLQLFKVAHAQEIPVVLASQCDSGNISLNAYESGKIFADLGAISAMDMTFEAASVKLMVQLGRKIPFAQRHKFFSTPLAHECSHKLTD